MKRIIILIVVLVLILGILGFFFLKGESNNVQSELENIESGESSNIVLEAENKKYNKRLVESDNKEFVTLYIETNLIDETEKVLIKYNNKKLILNTANPLLEEVEIEKGEAFNSFYINIEALKNYSIIFIKKDLNMSVSLEDVVL